MASAVESLFGQLNTARSQKLDESKLAEMMKQFQQNLTQRQAEQQMQNAQFQQTIGEQQAERAMREAAFNEQAANAKFLRDNTIAENISKGTIKPFDFQGEATQGNLAPGMIGVPNIPNSNAMTLGDKLFSIVPQEELVKRQAEQALKLKQQEQEQDWNTKTQLMRKAGVPTAMIPLIAANPNLLTAPLQTQMFQQAMMQGTPEALSSMIDIFGKIAAANETPTERASRLAMAENARASALLHRMQAANLGAVSDPTVGAKLNSYTADLINSGTKFNDPNLPGLLNSRVAADPSLTPQQKSMAWSLIEKNYNQMRENVSPFMQFMNSLNTQPGAPAGAGLGRGVGALTPPPPPPPNLGGQSVTPPPVQNLSNPVINRQQATAPSGASAATAPAPKIVNPETTPPAPVLIDRFNENNFSAPGEAVMRGNAAFGRMLGIVPATPGREPIPYNSDVNGIGPRSNPNDIQRAIDYNMRQAREIEAYVNSKNQFNTRPEEYMSLQRQKARLAELQQQINYGQQLLQRRGR